MEASSTEPLIDIEKGPVVSESIPEFTCGICYCDYPESPEEMRMLSECKHKFC